MLGYEIFREGERNFPNTLPNRELGGKRGSVHAHKFISNSKVSIPELVF
jgi:hypothetical protein